MHEFPYCHTPLLTLYSGPLIVHWSRKGPGTCHLCMIFLGVYRCLNNNYWFMSVLQRNSHWCTNNRHHPFFLLLRIIKGWLTLFARIHKLSLLFSFILLIHIGCWNRAYSTTCCTEESKWIKIETSARHCT